MKPKALDLFCGAGGATCGYQLAGFEVWGVDSRPQPHYCGDHFTQLDVFALPPWYFDDFDLIHASPPCQRHSALLAKRPNNRHRDLIGPTRDLLHSTGRPYVIENVPGAPLRPDIILCGSMFGLGASGRYLRRHRLFELSFTAPSDVPACNHKGEAIGVYGHGPWKRNENHTGAYQASAAERREAMGIHWGANRDEIGQAIPPAYTHWIGRRVPLKAEAAA